jgi:predicted DNA-binding protein
MNTTMKPNPERRVIVAVRLPAHLVESLKRIAKARGKTFTAMVEEAVKTHYYRTV